MALQPPAPITTRHPGVTLQKSSHGTTGALIHTSRRCNTLQHAATLCNTLQHAVSHAAVCCRESQLPAWHDWHVCTQNEPHTQYRDCDYSATHCSHCNTPVLLCNTLQPLQHTCTTLQHTAATAIRLYYMQLQDSLNIVRDRLPVVHHIPVVCCSDLVSTG